MLRENVTRGHQGFIYRVAERLHRHDAPGELAKAIEHAKAEGMDTEILTALCLLVVWRDRTFGELWPMIEQTRRGCLDVASGLAASGLCRASQIAPV